MDDLNTPEFKAWQRLVEDLSHHAASEADHVLRRVAGLHDNNNGKIAVYGRAIAVLATTYVQATKDIGQVDGAVRFYRMVTNSMRAALEGKSEG